MHVNKWNLLVHRKIRGGAYQVENHEFCFSHVEMVMRVICTIRYVCSEVQQKVGMFDG